MQPCITCSPLGACVSNAWCKSAGGVAQSAWVADSDTGIPKALAHDGGAAILDLAPAAGLALVGPWNVPESNFGGN